MGSVFKQLPDCKGSWFSEKYRHLRYSDWTRVMPVYMAMMSIALFHQYIAIQGMCMVAGKVGGAEKVSHWMTTLQGDAAMVMRNGSFWALVGKDGGAEKVSHWMTTLQGDEI
jgi:hypothetical protein